MDSQCGAADREDRMSEPARRTTRSDRPPGGSALEQQPLVEAARRGDEGAFRLLLDPLSGELYSHCFRMLASVQDAEDAMQEVMLRAWRALSTYEGRAPLRSWLYRIATNVCLDAIEKRPKRVVPLDRASTLNRKDDTPIEASARRNQDGRRPGAQGEASEIETAYEHRETAALAFSVALHRLPAKQRAVLILRDVLGFSARETASSLQITITAVNSALQRARARLDDGLDPDRPQRSPRALGDRRFQDAAEGFVEALRRGDIDALVGIAGDTTLSDRRSWTFSPLPT
jgi:RNA polymerase sigma-70 factor, ECF subfamily